MTKLKKLASRAKDAVKSRRSLKPTPRPTKPQLILFVLVFAGIGSYFLFRSFAASESYLSANHLSAGSSLRASVITENQSRTKRSSPVVQLANGAVNCPADVNACARAGLVDASKPLDPGVYTACLVGRAPGGSGRASLELKTYVGTTPAASLTSGTFRVEPTSEYGRVGCLLFVIGTTTEVHATATNLTANNNLRVGSVLIRRVRPISPVYSAKAGNWSDPTVWSNRQVPGAGDKPIISHQVNYDMDDHRVAGAIIRSGGVLAFNPNRTSRLESSANIRVDGILRMKPTSENIVHSLVFAPINENRFIGGGMDPVPSDVGLWVMGDGQLDIEGANKTAWTRLTGSASAGAKSLTLETAPTGWRKGDLLAVAPTRQGDYRGFDSARIESVSGNTVTLDRGLAVEHPKVSKWTAEVMNLSRNVRIEGTGNSSTDPTTNGRTHIFIRSTKPQYIKYVSIEHVGPRPARISTQRPIPSEQTFPSPMDTTGRYGLHFHHSGDGSRGSLVEGTIIRDAGNHAYVPHTSHGITFRNTISFNTYHDAYWWDGPTCPSPCNTDNHRQYKREPEITNDTLYENAIAARVKSGSNVFRLSGFELGKGAGNVVRNSVAVGVDDTREGSGFKWPEGAIGVWGFTNNIAHNNGMHGIFAWQNSDKPHVINNFEAYHNVIGIGHGAYTNDYQYKGGTLYGNSQTGIHLLAVSQTSNKIRFSDMVIDAAGIGESAIETGRHRASRTNPTVLTNMTMRGFTGKAAVIFRTGDDKWDRIDIINPNITGNPFYRERLPAGSEIRVRSGNTAYKITPDNQSGSSFVQAWNAYRTNIPVF